MCSISAGLVTFNAAGSCVIDFNQAGNANYNAATQVQQTVGVGQDSPDDHLHLHRSHQPGGRRHLHPDRHRVTRGSRSRSRSTPPRAPGVLDLGRRGDLHSHRAAASSTSTRPATPTTPPRPRSSRRSESARSPADDHRHLHRAHQPGGRRHLHPHRHGQLGAYGRDHDRLDASSIVCSISAGVVTFNAAGSCVIDFNQAGNSTYAAAPQVQQTVVSAKVADHHLHLHRAHQRRPWAGRPTPRPRLPARG